MRTIYVHVKLRSNQFAWRTVQAETLDEAMKLATAMPDVAWCYEVSFLPGGVVT